MFMTVCIYIYIYINTLQLCITLGAYWSGGCMYSIAYVNAVISRKIPVMLLFEP